MHLVLFYYQPGIACIGEVGLRNWTQVSKLAFVVVVCAPVTSQQQTALTAARLFSCSLHHALKNVSVRTTGGKGVKNQSYDKNKLNLVENKASALYCFARQSHKKFKCATTAASDLKVSHISLHANSNTQQR